jgi:hypothetical protein
MAILASERCKGFSKTFSSPEPFVTPDVIAEG